MKSYDELSKTRQLAIDVIVRAVPETMDTGTIPLRELKFVFDRLKEQRAEGGLFVGFPIWLTTDKQYRSEKRGVYLVPLPKEIKENLTSERMDDKITYNYYTPESFRDELVNAGIDVQHINF